MEHGERYDNVLLTDTRDVIFQKDPFDFSFGDTLCCFTELETMVIADTPSETARWIEQSFGKQELMELSQKPIICAGITIGSARRILEYLEIFMRTVAEHDVPCVAGYAIYRPSCS